MRAISRLFVAVALGAAATVLVSAPAQAHTANFVQDCEVVTVNLTKFAKSTPADPNKVNISVNGTVIKTVEFTSQDQSVTFKDASYAEAATTWRAEWTKTGADDHSGDHSKVLKPGKDCVKPTTPPVTTPPASTPPPATASPSVEPVVITTTPTKPALAVTGQNIAVFIGIGAVLVALGAGAIIFTRRKRVAASGSGAETAAIDDLEKPKNKDDKES